MKSFKQNMLSFKSLSHLLASKDTVLILKLDSGLRCQQYWALIPPAVTDGDTNKGNDVMVVIFRFYKITFINEL